eukprot:EG_transcript_22471
MRAALDPGWGLLLLCLGGWGLQAAGLGAVPGLPPAVALDAAGLEATVLGSRHMWVVEFFDSSHSGDEAQRVEAEVEKAMAALKGICRFGTVDVARPGAASLVGRYGLAELPALRLFARRLGPAAEQGRPVEGRGDAVVASVKAALPTTIPRLTSIADLRGPDPDSATAPAGAPPPWVLLFTEKRATPTLFRALAAAFQGELRFADVRDSPPLAQAFGVTACPSVLVAGHGPDSGSQLGLSVTVYKGPLTYAALADFLAPFAAAQPAPPIVQPLAPAAEAEAEAEAEARLR